MAFGQRNASTIVYQNNVDTLSDEALLDSVERASFRYFWDGAEPRSGMARERIHIDGEYPEHDQDVITVGGSGFGMMAILAGIHRGYITRSQGVQRLQRIVNFLSHADRFHGAWPHWLYPDGRVKPFSPKDDGGDIVETAFLIQGLLSARQFLRDDHPIEKQIKQRIDSLWKSVEWSWYQHGQQVLYWHWSPHYGWAMNFPIHGYNECLITYILAASSPTHPIPASAYHQGWASNGKIVSPSWHYGYELQLYHQGNATLGGPLFWAHYSYLGLNPHGLKDHYADYEKENFDQTMINYLWCVNNPLHYKGYGPHNWGLTASYSIDGYAAHAPGEHTDLGVISPTAAVSSVVYTPAQSLQAMRYWFTHPEMKNKLWGPYGFYDAFSETANWYPKRYLAIDQGPQVVMIENYRSGLLWRLFMSCPEVQKGLKKLGFQYEARNK
ncbi:MAG: beta-glucosidase [Thermoflavifilum sp.]|nr:beta-glucosidase [Thermoflavifilum sp.]